MQIIRMIFLLYIVHTSHVLQESYVILLGHQYRVGTHVRHAKNICTLGALGIILTQQNSNRNTVCCVLMERLASVMQSFKHQLILVCILIYPIRMTYPSATYVNHISINPLHLIYPKVEKFTLLAVMIMMILMRMNSPMNFIIL